MLVISDISKRFGGVKALESVSLSLAPSELLALIGPNGAGKSTLFGIIGGQIKPDAGEIRLRGRDITGTSPSKIFRSGIGRTFQIANLFLSRSVRENVLIALFSKYSKVYSMWQPAEKLYRVEVEEILEKVGLAHHQDEACSSLSYSDMKRLELAVSLAGNPTVILMDEPTAGMSQSEKWEMMELVDNLVKNDKLGVLLVEHDLDIVRDCADRAIYMEAGRIVFSGTIEEVVSSEQVSRRYLGIDA